MNVLVFNWQDKKCWGSALLLNVSPSHVGIIRFDHDYKHLKRAQRFASSEHPRTRCHMPVQYKSPSPKQFGKLAWQ